MKQLVKYVCGIFLGFLLLGCKNDVATDPRFDGLSYDPKPYILEYPFLFPQATIPAENPMTVEGVELGRRLFYDPVLHIDQQRSCATCHIQAHAFSSDAEVLPHINLGWNSVFLWKGEVQGTLEDIMLFEVEKFFQADLDRLNQDATYPGLFYEAFGEKEITYPLIAKAMAQFERTMISGNSLYDKIMRGEYFFTDEQYNGFELFNTEEGDCFHCHSGILFTDNLFHNNGLDAMPDAGLFGTTGDPLDIGRFKAPTLRNIALTGPYMHDGRYATLKDVLDFYSEGVRFSETIDPLMKQVHNGGVQLTEKEKEDLIAFLHTLTDSSYITNPDLSDPFR